MSTPSTPINMSPSSTPSIPSTPSRPPAPHHPPTPSPYTTNLLTTYPPIRTLMSLEHTLLSPTPLTHHPAPYALCPICLTSELSLAGIPPVDPSRAREPALLLPCSHLVGAKCWTLYSLQIPDSELVCCPIAGCRTPLNFPVCGCGFEPYLLRGWVPYTKRMEWAVPGLRESVEGMAEGLPKLGQDGRPKVPRRCGECVWAGIERERGEAQRAGERGRGAREAERMVAEAERVMAWRVVGGMVEREFERREVEGRGVWRCKGCRRGGRQ